MRDFPPEDGATYEENARGKAQYGRGSPPPDAWVIGEDSGIEAAGLGGRPGIASARWADDGVARMLAELDGVADRARPLRLRDRRDRARRARRSSRAGRSRADRDRAAAATEGFGYDPIFVPDGEARTVAELGNDWKTSHSHRARAAARSLPRFSRGRANSRPAEAVTTSDSVGAVDPTEALAELTTLSSQIEERTRSSASRASCSRAPGRPSAGEQLARVAADLIAAAADVRRRRRGRRASR